MDNEPLNTNLEFRVLDGTFYNAIAYKNKDGLWRIQTPMTDEQRLMIKEIERLVKKVLWNRD